MILMYLFLLVLIFAEVLDESVNLDLHDARSQFKLVLVFITAELIGLIAGINYGFLVYGLIRIALFDMLFGYTFVKDWFYLGETSRWDKFIKKIPLPILLGLRLKALILSIYIIL